ncbi:hypothetical protein GCM10010399_82510 [Dactylosporangium fulvum]|uniref:HK97 gp10 family phage protein n=1 Tax=Dactylosporangium fulvum TaxID=53359 RepID=A0ABY5W783_9ACTN|nr:hypothetical protein [Dactylosporangium fulvum]UWP85878.1 hypothetical protein Dfulv_17165 [Dactylosporangium fulvum]
MADVEFRENRAGVAEMMRSPAMLAAMEHLGNIVQIDAEQIAAVDTGAYAFGTNHDPGVTGGGFKVDAQVRGGVASVIVSNDVRSAPSTNWPQGYPYGIAQEFGNEHVEARHTLGRALDALSTHI